ncbi:hypothetical protein ART_0158 [Arthrobacter sp. PAMC 25486]|uniref:hypothetical protein n=1 Tax=Arthrobacter sp. PAMC 25486 TaxID=1494608 RepID=UPI000535C8CD|nr:hypothetical protein [Arthrobacter sp. PAMC 25486]AIX99756.1 hypothetical protein ART_0158 [Arthrobacter sp. PAMC 25486]
MTGQRVATLDKADAVQRAFRTLWQGFGFDAVAAIGAGLLLLLDGGDVLSPVFWAAVGVLVVKSVLVAFASYLQRLRKAPKPLPEPPLPEPDPALTADYHKAVDRDRQAIYGVDGK